jgi:hypothetical protein
VEYICILQQSGEPFVDAFLSDTWDERMSRWVSGQEALDMAEDADKENLAGPSK